MALIRVLLADDHTLFRKGVRTLLEQKQNIEVVGEASDGQQVVSQAQELVPDVTRRLGLSRGFQPSRRGPLHCSTYVG